MIELSRCICGETSSLDAIRISGYRRLNQLIRDGLCVPVFYEPLTYEWINHGGLDQARRNARVFDQARFVDAVEPDTILFLIEAMNEIRLLRPDLGIPPLLPRRPFSFTSEAVEFLRPHCAELRDTRHSLAVVPVRGQPSPRCGGIDTVVQAVAEVIGKRPHAWEDAFKGLDEAIGETYLDQKKHPTHRGYPDDVVRTWLCRNTCADEVLGSLDPSCNVDDLFRQIEVARCPATVLRTHVFDMYARSNRSLRKRNDLIDLAWVPAIAYCDIALVEGKFARGYIRQAARKITNFQPIVTGDVLECVEQISPTNT